MARLSKVTLPPKVEGAASKGTLALRLGPLVWEPAAGSPAGVVAAVKWWGDDGPGDVLETSPAPPAVLAGSAAACSGGATQSAGMSSVQFRLVSGPKYITRYLQDMGTLVLVLKQPVTRGTGSRSSVESAIVGTTTVDLRPLSVGAPLSHSLPVIGEQGRAIGSLGVSLALEFSTAVVSSFEMNEHLAAREVEAAEAAAAAAGSDRQAIHAEAAFSLGSAAGPVHPAPPLEQLQQQPTEAAGTELQEGCLPCPQVFRHLDAALGGIDWEVALAKLGLDGPEAALSSPEQVAQLTDLTLPGATKAAASYAAAALSISQPESSETWQLEIGALEDAIRLGADMEGTLESEPGVAARKLTSLISQLSNQHLDVAKAFGREDGLSYKDLVAVLRNLVPAASSYELQSLLAVLVGMDRLESGKVTLADLKQAITAISFAQAYPTAEEVLQQQQAAAARKEKAEAAVAPAMRSGSKEPPSQRKLQAVGRLRSAARQSRPSRLDGYQAGSDSGTTATGQAITSMPGASGAVATGLATGHVSHEQQLGANPQGLAMLWQQAGAAASAGMQPTSLVRPPAPAGPAGAGQPAVSLAGSLATATALGPGVVLGIPVSLPGEALPIQPALQPPPLQPHPQPPQSTLEQHSFPPSGAASSLACEQLHHANLPLQPLAFSAQQPPRQAMPAVQEPLQQPMQQLPLTVYQPNMGQLPVWQPGSSDPLQALISRAENLKLAMSRAAFQPSLLGGPVIGPHYSTASLQISGNMAAGGQSAALTGLSTALPPSQPGAASFEATAMAVGCRHEGTAMSSGSLAGFAGGNSHSQDPGTHLSAASAALIEAARALTAGQEAPRGQVTSQVSAAAGLASKPGTSGRSSGLLAQDSSLGAEAPAAATAIEGAPGGSSMALTAPQLGAQPTAAMPAADAASELSWDDPAELAEDVILQELFFSQPAKPRPAEAGAAVSAGSHEELQGGQASQQQQVQQKSEDEVAMAGPAAPELIISLQLHGLQLSRQVAARTPQGDSSGMKNGAAGSARLQQSEQAWLSQGCRVKGVVKPLHPSAQPMNFALVSASSRSSSSNAPQRTGQFEGPRSAACATELEIAVPRACIEQGRLPTTLFVEIWDQTGNQLMGIVRAPLSHCPLSTSSEEATEDLPAVVCEGRYDVWNLLEGRAEGSLEIFAVLQVKGTPRMVPAVRHGFSVTIQTAYRLPGSVAYAEAELHAPDSRYVKYTFPGEPEPLYTKEVPVMSNPTFDATAHHRITLLPDQDITAVLAASGPSRKLRFEVWDQWVDDKEELHAWAEVPMPELAGLARTFRADSPPTTPEAKAVAGPGGTDGAAKLEDAAQQASQSLLLPLVTEYDLGPTSPSTAAAAGASAKGPALRVDLAYHMQRVLVPAPPEPKRPRQQGYAAPGRLSTGAGLQAGLVDAAADKEVAARQQQSGTRLAASTNKGPNQEQRQRLQRHLQPSQQDQPQAVVTTATGRGRQPPGPSSFADVQLAEEDEEGEDDENNVLLANRSPAKPVRAAAPPKGVEAVLCVEIIRACGLAAAVREACAFSSGNPALSRARQVGAHPFARLALFPSDAVLQKRAPPLQTPFQAQTFCPEFHARHEYSLRLDARTLQALAEQELLVEVWHHLPRAQAVAAALSAGRSSQAVAGGGGADAAGAAEREVFLGSASGPLMDILRRPQGFRGWLGLKSRRGEPVGAIQLAIHLSELQGQPVFAAHPDRSPLQQCEAAADVLPPHLGWLLDGAGAEAFGGQQATAVVAVEEVAPPQEEKKHGLQELPGRDGDRPKADLFFATYRLPGAPGSHSTAAKTLTAGAAGKAAVPGLAGRAWSAKLGHMGCFQITAGALLRKALTGYPLAVTVYKQAATSGAKGSRAAQPVPVHVGTAEVDLSGLIWGRQPGTSGNSRSVSGSFLLVDPAAKSLGNARVRLRVTLDFDQQQLQHVPGNMQRWELEGEEDERLDTSGENRAQRADLQLQQIQPSRQQRAQGPQQLGSDGEDSEAESEDGSSTATPAPSKPSADAAQPKPAPVAVPLEASCSPAVVRHVHPAARTSAASVDAEILTAGEAPCSGGGSTEGGAQGQQNTSSGQGATVGQQEDAAGSANIGTGAAQWAPAGAPQGRLQEQSVPAADRPDSGSSAGGDAGKLLVHVESAVRLPCARPASAASLRRSASPAGDGSSSSARGVDGSSSGDTGSSPDSCSAYVAITWGPLKRKHRTATAAVQGPAGPSSSSAAWREVVELEADAALWGGRGTSSSSGTSDAASPAAAAQPNASRPRQAQGNGGPILLLNVWTCPADEVPEAGVRPRPPTPQPRGAELLSARAGHALIGCAAIDLSMLPLLGEVRGYWNIVDYLQQVRGQLLVSVRPDDTLLAQLQAARARGPAISYTALAGRATGATLSTPMAAAGGYAAAGSVARDFEIAVAGSGADQEGPAAAGTLAVPLEEAEARAPAPAPAPQHSQQAEPALPRASPQSGASVAAREIRAVEGQEQVSGKPAAAEAAEGLLGELQARMQALQLLSQRLSREPTAAEEPGELDAPQLQPTSAAVGTLVEGRAEDATGAAGSQISGAQVTEAGQWAAATAEPQVGLRTIEFSDEEADEREGGFLTGLRRHVPRGRATAWSESDSDDDDLDLLGVAVEGAVSPGAESEDEEPPRQAAAPRRPTLMADDWMFDISRPEGPDPAAASSTSDIQQGPAGQEDWQQQGVAGQASAGDLQDAALAPGRHVGFQNVLVPNVPAEPLPAGQAVPMQLEQQQQPSSEGTAVRGPTSHPAHGSSAVEQHQAEMQAQLQAEPSSSHRPLPVMPQLQRPARPHAAAAVAPPQRGNLLGLGVGFAGRGNHDSWLFDITKPPQPRGPPIATVAAGAQLGEPGGTTSAAPAAASGVGGKTQSPYHQYLTLQPRPGPGSRGGDRDCS
ncbi:hypothetical protein N2152v2_003317 [Parachlorella kessleri]